MKIIIFAGGYGTRMWPASRKSHPKQFWPVVHGQSFFQQTVSRFKKGFKAKDIMVSTEEPYRKFVRKQAPDIPTENIIIEPERRDLLGAVGLVAAVVEKKFPGEVMFFSWSDHFVSKKDEFIKAVKAAGDYTKKTGKPTSINEKPTFAATMLGWLEMGKKVTTHNGYPIFEIKRHIEKPKMKSAKKYLGASNYLIHTGYGAWKSDLMLGYYKEHRPAEYAGLVKIMDSWGTKMQETVVRQEYHKFERISVEHGLYEKLPHGLRVTIPVDTGWEDAGTWKLFYSAMKEKGEKNVTEGGVETQFIDSEGNLVVGQDGKMVSVIGLNNVVVIDTKDGLLVTDMDQADKVKQLFKKLEEENPKFVK